MPRRELGVFSMRPPVTRNALIGNSFRRHLQGISQDAG
jgi:hypothetical protein